MLATRRIGLASLLILLVTVAARSEPKNEPAKTGIDRAKILKFMTSESNSVILFDDRGAVVSTDNKYVTDAMMGRTIVPSWGVLAGKKYLPEVAAMKGKVMATFSARGIGNRFTREKAEAILDDLIKAQSSKPVPDPFDEIENRLKKP